MKTAQISFDRVSKEFAGQESVVRAVDNISLEIQKGEFITLLGPSGCGKTTTLRMIAGFETPSSGTIHLAGKVINDLPPNKRDTAMVFQSYAIFPHYNIYDNIAYGLKIHKVPKDEIKERVERIIELVGLKELAQRSPSQLSGGQQQRVALARALVMEPSVLLFDEPLSNLDAKLRVYMRNEIKKIQESLGLTSVYVTHDQTEAMSLSDRIIIMNRGKIEQIGTPAEIYQKPRTKFVADFIGAANFIDCQVVEVAPRSITVRLGEDEFTVETDLACQSGEMVTVVVRPEAIEVGESGQLTGRVLRSTFMGNVQEYDIAFRDQSLFVEVANPLAKKIYQVGEEVKLQLHGSSLHIIRDER